jgi:uncharacterized protein with PIN domain
VSKKPTRCERCGRRLRNPRGARADAWVLRVPRAGWPLAAVCPDCQTGLEHVEAEVNSATLRPESLGGLGVRLVPRA